MNFKGDFESAKNLIKSYEADKLCGIGTYKEKNLHYILKNYIEPLPENQEIKVGKMRADILNEDGIIEIQTRSFNNLRKKLDTFLKDYTVTVVYPYASVKWLSWLDPNTGEVSSPRKSPKKANIYESFYELYKIKSFLTHPNLKFCLIGLEIREIKLLDGWSEDRKKGSQRFERYPLSITEITQIECSDDFSKFLPRGLPEIFTVKDYSKCAKITVSKAYKAVNCLNYCGTIKREGKSGRAFTYRVVKH